MVATCFALRPTWPWIDRGIEYPFLMLFLAVYISFESADRYCVDRIIGARLEASVKRGTP